MTYKAENEDIDFLIDVLEEIRKSPDNTELQRKFATRHAGQVIALLEELQKDREEKACRHIDMVKGGVSRVIVEGFSEKDMHDAFSKALAKVTPCFSEYRDVSVSVLGLVKLPKGGYHATLEVHITPVKMSDTKKMAGQDVELKHIRDKDYKTRKTRHEEHLKHLVLDHFLDISGRDYEVPDYFMININDADLLNMMIEKDFFKAGHKVFDDDLPPQVMVRLRHRPEGDGG